MNSIEERLQRIDRALTLIAASARTAADADSDGPVQTVDIISAIEEVAAEVLLDMHWLKLLPGSVLNLPAPDDDDVQDHYREVFDANIGELNLDEERQRIIDEAIAQRDRDAREGREP